MADDLLLRVDRKLAGSGSVAAICDEKDELDFYAEVGLVEHAFADPSLLRRRLDGQRVCDFLDDDNVPLRLFPPTAARPLLTRRRSSGRRWRPGFAWACGRGSGPSSASITGPTPRSNSR